MKLSFIIPAHNEEGYLGDCLASVLEAAGASKWETEVIVVDNVSTDRTAEVAGLYPRVRVVKEPHKGLTWARQAGLEAATGDFLAYLDADVRLPRSWMRILEEELEREPGLVSLSGPYRYYDLFGWRRFLAEGGWWLSAPLTYRLVGYMVLGGNFVARREALIKIGGFDTSISFYGEDTNIAWRLRRFGPVKFRMDFFVWSSGRRLAGEGLLKSYWVYGVNFLWGVLFRKPFTRHYKDIR